MKRIGRKYILILLMFLTTLLCAVGSSTWIILSEKKATLATHEPIQPTISNVTLSTIYYKKQAQLESYSLTVTSGDSTIDVSSYYTASVSSTTNFFTGIGTSSTINCIQKATVTFTSKDPNVYATVTQSNITVKMHAVTQNSSNQYFSTIDSAIANTSSGTIYVIPTNTGDSAADYKNETQTAKDAKTITSNAEIKSGVTLSLPYSGTTTIKEMVHDSAYKQNAYSKASTYLKNQIILNASLTVNGTINIGGQYFAGGGGSFAGQTGGNFAQITLGTSGSLIVNGTVNAYGFIKGSTDSDDIQFQDGSTLLMPFVLYEFRGGTVSTAMQKTSNTFYSSPFVRFSFVNIVGAYKIHYGATAKANACMRATVLISAQSKEQSTNIISKNNDCLLQLAQGSFAEVVYTPWSSSTKDNAWSWTYQSNDKTVSWTEIFGEIDLTINGGAILHALDINVESIMSVNSREVYLPISYIFDITLKNGNYDISEQNLAIFPGGQLKIDSSASLVANSIAVYSTSPEQGAAGYFPYPTVDKLNGESGELIVNGSLTTNYLGGNVITENDSAMIKVNTAMSVTDALDLLTFYDKETTTPSKTGTLDIANGVTDLNATYHKIHSGSILGGKAAVIYYKPRHEYTALSDYNGGDNYTSAGTYYSKKRSDGSFGWGIRASLTVNSNSGSEINSSSDLILNETYILTEDDLPIQTKAYHTFNWYYDEDCTQVATVGDPIKITSENMVITLYPKFTPITYNINYVYTGLGEVDYPDIPNDLPTSFQYVDSDGDGEIDKITFRTDIVWDNYVFAGWYYDQNCQNEVPTGELSFATLYSKCKNDEVTIYGKWANEIYEYTVILTNGNNAPYAIEKTNTVKDLNYNPTGTDIEGLFTDVNQDGKLDKEDPTIQNYFVGWYLDADYQNVYNPADGLNIENGGTRTLYAKWNNKITVNKVVDDATTLVGYYAPNAELTTESAPEKKGYIFTHWTITNIANSVAANEAFSLVGEDGSTVNITAEYEQLVEVTIDLDDGSLSGVETTQYVRANGELTTPAAPTKTGYIFTHWAIEGGVGGTVEASTAIVLSETIGDIVTLKAIYEALVEVTIDLDGGSLSGVETTQYVRAGDEFTPPTLPPTKTGYTFTHWKITGGDHNGEEIIDTAIVLSNTHGAKVKLKAIYSPNPITIKILLNKGSLDGSTADKTYEIEINEEFTPPQPTRTNYKLTGWKVDNGDYAGQTLEAGETFVPSKETPGITVTLTAQWEYNGCFATGTLITLADGTQKPIEQITENDYILVFDHVSGQYIASGILFYENSGNDYYNIVNLEFSNGQKTRIIYEHGLFDLTLNKYVYITESNYSEFVGHEFALMNTELGYERVTLENAYITNEYTGCYSITSFAFNYFIDGLFSMPGAIDGLFNIFEYGEGLKYDEEKMQADIEKYGLFTYEDFKELVPIEVFEAVTDAKYFKVAIGKGLITWEEIVEIIQKYLNF